MTGEDYLARIEISPQVMVGKPVIRGTRIPVELIMRLVKQGISDADILNQYPRLQPEDIYAAQAYAAAGYRLGVECVNGGL